MSVHYTTIVLIKSWYKLPCRIARSPLPTGSSAAAWLFYGSAPRLPRRRRRRFHRRRRLRPRVQPRWAPLWSSWTEGPTVPWWAPVVRTGCRPGPSFRAGTCPVSCTVRRRSHRNNRPPRWTVSAPGPPAAWRTPTLARQRSAWCRRPSSKWHTHSIGSYNKSRRIRMQVNKQYW